MKSTEALYNGGPLQGVWKNLAALLVRPGPPFGATGIPKPCLRPGKLNRFGQRNWNQLKTVLSSLNKANVSFQVRINDLVEWLKGKVPS